MLYESLSQDRTFTDVMGTPYTKNVLFIKIYDSCNIPKQNLIAFMQWYLIGNVISNKLSSAIIQNNKFLFSKNHV